MYMAESSATSKFSVVRNGIRVAREAEPPW